MQYLSVVNLAKYQHYSKRNPPWVKLHRETMTDYTLRTMPVQTRFLFAMLWLIASENGNRIPYDMKWLSERIGMTVTEAIILPLLANNVITHTSSVSVSPLSLTENSNSLASCKQSASSSLASQDDEFEKFWQGYPKKKGRKDAKKAWVKAQDKPALNDILSAIENAKLSDQWLKDKGQFIPYPATWLNKGCWADEPTVNGTAISLTCPSHTSLRFPDATAKRTHDQLYHPKFEG